MMIKIAWRNIWRDKRRTNIVLTSIIIGMISIIFLDAFVEGSTNQMLQNQLNTNIAHIQIHKTGYRNNRVISNYIPDYQKAEQAINLDNNVEHSSGRVISFGLINSSSNSSGINMVGINPADESEVTKIQNMIISGNYLSGKKHEILISKKMSEKLNVEIGDKIVIMVSAMEGKMSSDVFRVKGIFATSAAEFDKFYVFISKDNAQEMLGLGENITEIAIKLKKHNLIMNTRENLKSRLGNEYEVNSYDEIIPMIITLIETTKSMTKIIYVIIGIALIFGIINTKLMSVFERIREFGIMMANGMKNIQVFKMIILEAIFLGCIGAIIGNIIGLGICIPLSKYGINLSTFAQSFSTVGYTSIIYPEINFFSIVNSSLIIIFTTVLGALYPAIKALKLVPVKAIRYI